MSKVSYDRITTNPSSATRSSAVDTFVVDTLAIGASAFLVLSSLISTPALATNLILSHKTSKRLARELSKDPAYDSGSGQETIVTAALIRCTEQLEPSSPEPSSLALSSGLAKQKISCTAQPVPPVPPAMP